MQIFVSHAWDTTSYFLAKTLIDDAIDQWEDLSVTRESALRFSADRRAAAAETVFLLGRRLDDSRARLQQMREAQRDTIDALEGETLARQRDAENARQRVASALLALEEAGRILDHEILDQQDTERLRRELARLTAVWEIQDSLRERRLKEQLLAAAASSRFVVPTSASQSAAVANRTAAQAELEAARSSQTEAENALTEVTSRLNAARAKTSGAANEIRNTEWQIEREERLIGDLQHAEDNFEAAVDLRYVLPHGGGKFSGLQWLRGADVLTTNIALAIHQRIGKADMVVLALSDGFVYRPWLEFEFRSAADWRRPVIALETARIPKDFAYYVTRVEPTATALRVAIEHASSSSTPFDYRSGAWVGAGDYFARFSSRSEEPRISQFDTHEWMRELNRSGARHRWEG